jgi:CRP-like cAMP-binding protein
MKPKKRPAFDVESFLMSLGIVAKIREYHAKEVIFSQGDPVTKVIYFIRRGSVKRSVVSRSGKERVVGILGAGDFLGTGSLADYPIRPATTTAILPTTVLVISKKNMVRALHSHHVLSDRFISYVVGRSIKTEEALINRLFHSSGKRLARALMQLAQYGQHKKSETILPTVSQQLLADMIGTSRQQVNTLMNKFRKMGFIEYNGELKIYRSLLCVTLCE